tara:strand:+ start:198 stop:416 length:219 start_codon:yes stop_codon:yes gene_type:complete
MCLASLFPATCKDTKLSLALSSALPQGAFQLTKYRLNLDINYSNLKTISVQLADVRFRQNKKRKHQNIKPLF